MTAATGFDRIAHQYDALWTHSNAGKAQRTQVWRVAKRYFRPGQSVLDIGCGTGADAMYLEARGVRISAIDASREMTRIATARGVRAIQLSAEELDAIDGRWDGALSNFGALNCVRDLRAVAGSLRRLIRPRGHALLCLLNRRCAWELGRARRSGTRNPGVAVQYPSGREVRHAFGDGFELVESRAVGLFVPPSYVRLGPHAARLAATVDAWLAGAPGLRALGDHRLFVFRRSDDALD